MDSTDRASSEDLRSALVTTVTPFDDAGEVSYEEMASHCRYLVDNGMTVLIPCGNTGEFSSLSTDEAKLVTAATVEAVSGRAVVIAGVGGPTATAIELAVAAEEAGAAGIMIHHPMHTYIDRRGLAEYYERIIDSVGIGVVLYKRGPELEDRLILELVEHDRVLGVKYAVNDLNAFTNLIATSKARVTWICGTAERWAPFFFLGGASAFSSGLANFAPRKALELFALLKASQYDRAMKMRAELAVFEEIRQERYAAYNVPAVKAAMGYLGLCRPTVREPLRDLDADAATRVRECVTAWGTPLRVDVAAES